MVFPKEPTSIRKCLKQEYIKNFLKDYEFIIILSIKYDNLLFTYYTANYQYVNFSFTWFCSFWSHIFFPSVMQVYKLFTWAKMCLG